MAAAEPQSCCKGGGAATGGAETGGAATGGAAKACAGAPGTAVARPALPELHTEDDGNKRGRERAEPQSRHTQPA